MARVFIGIPTLNRPDMVREAIHSVLAQSYCDWAAVVSDNLSTGNTSAQVAEYVSNINDKRLTFFQQPVNEGEYGQGRLFFKLAREADSDYLVILHDDDVLEPNYLEQAIAALDKHPDASFFVCNPNIIDVQGAKNSGNTSRFDERWGRTGLSEGYIDVLNTHMRCGFTPISAAFFRIDALIKSGFVDSDLTGCFPFESNIFLRLGELGERAWFSPERLFRLRWHNQQMTNWGFLSVSSIVNNTVVLFERRHFTGNNEYFRLQALGRLYRVRAFHRARERDHQGARHDALLALRTNPASLRTVLFGSAILLAPGLIGYIVRKHFVPLTYSTV